MGHQELDIRRLIGRWWLPERTGFPRTLDELTFRNVVVLFAVSLMAYFYIDVGPRARILPGKQEEHRTDFTVYTEAGSAFFDGRKPYEVGNPRSWTYIYPPLLALMVAPLSLLDSEAQALVWFTLSAILCLGSYEEARRIWRFLLPTEKGDARLDPSGRWVGLCAGMTMFLPTLACLQRGQVGIVLLYSLLLGYRLILTSRNRPTLLLGGVLLAWPVVVKLVPALPVGFLVWQHWLLALGRERSRHDFVRASILSLSIMAGVFLFLLALPGAVLGWNANLRHLQTWSRKVVTCEDPGSSYKAFLDSTNNQSFGNAVHLLVARWRVERPDDLRHLLLRLAKTPAERQIAEDEAATKMRIADTTTQRWIQISKGVMLALLLGVALVPSRSDRLGHAVTFGLACLGILLISPVAWTHYFMMALPAVLFFPPWLSRRGYSRIARWMAGTPVLLVWLHFLAKEWIGPYGFLGLSTTGWFLIACVLMIREGILDLRSDSTSRPPRAVASQSRQWYGPHRRSRKEDQALLDERLVTLDECAAKRTAR